MKELDAKFKKLHQKHAKLGKRSRKKGQVAEREVVKLFENWWKEAERDVSFARTPSSGGWATSKTRSDFQASGDISTNSKYFPFCVEVKRQEQFSYEQLFKGHRSPVWGWWKQAQRQAKESQLQPLLIFRASKLPWGILVPKNLKYLYEDNASFGKRLKLNPYCSWDTVLIKADIGLLQPYFFLADDFFRLSAKGFMRKFKAIKKEIICKK